MNYYKIINPSDGVLLTGDDDTLVAVTVMYMSNGAWGVRRLDNEADLSLYAFAGGDRLVAQLKELGIDNLDAYLDKNWARMADLLDTVCYGRTAEDAQALETALAKLQQGERVKARAKYNDDRRSSMTNIGYACLENARRIREWLARERML